MTNVEKIIADLIDQQKITGEQAVILIKSLQSNEKLSDSWIPVTTPPSIRYYNNENYNCLSDSITAAI